MDPEDILAAAMSALKKPPTAEEYIERLTKHRDAHLDRAAKIDSIISYLKEHPDVAKFVDLLKDMEC